MAVSVEAHTGQTPTPLQRERGVIRFGREYISYATVKPEAPSGTIILFPGWGDSEVSEQDTALSVIAAEGNFSVTKFIEPHGDGRPLIPNFGCVNQETIKATWEVVNKVSPTEHPIFVGISRGGAIAPPAALESPQDIAGVLTWNFADSEYFLRLFRDFSADGIKNFKNGDTEERRLALRFLKNLFASPRKSAQRAWSLVGGNTPEAVKQLVNDYQIETRVVFSRDDSIFPAERGEQRIRAQFPEETPVEDANAGVIFRKQSLSIARVPGSHYLGTAQEFGRKIVTEVKALQNMPQTRRFEAQ